MGEELQVVLTCMKNTNTTCCRDNTKANIISEGIGFWRHVDRDSYAHFSEYYEYIP